MWTPGRQRILAPEPRISAQQLVADGDSPAIGSGTVCVGWRQMASSMPVLRALDASHGRAATRELRLAVEMKSVPPSPGMRPGVRRSGLPADMVPPVTYLCSRQEVKTSSNGIKPRSCAPANKIEGDAARAGTDAARLDAAVWSEPTCAKKSVCQLVLCGNGLEQTSDSRGPRKLQRISS